MTETVIAAFSSAAKRGYRLAVAIARLLRRIVKAHATRRALAALSDEALRDVGLSRCEIDHVADSLARQTSDATRDPERYFNRSAAYLEAARHKAWRLAPHAALRIG
ncbi:MAG: DUF1127 domain-containing protein [Pseudorhodoplanes sp.]